MNHEQGLLQGITWGMAQGIVNVPQALLQSYRALGLNDTEAMLLIQLLSFRQQELNAFPSMEQLELRMGASDTVISLHIQRLMREGWIAIDEVTDALGIRYEHYNLTGMYEKLSVFLAEEMSGSMSPQDQKVFEQVQLDHVEGSLEEQERNLFVTFEKEFARPLSPMECETISGWLDQDQYADELIRLALKEAVFAGKIHFRYIDRILLEWSRNRVKTAEDAKAFTQKFRNQGKS
ncbi:DNA replication protein [Paenibacillus shirakamiensis]|uniref:DNA replication protein n=1 Tax=Paenibacillus shirakamiensis TaxID=1265935 RepID=A0ABS4JD12_9BACL|nr:DnaD domain-containing protein [Paenibacillus shirakamiensis]MBP1999588.1 DNA replication protein [Paenibacillus shirakamiensis]